MSEPKLSPGSGGIRCIPNPVQRHKELGVTDREQQYDETPIYIQGLGALGAGVPSARVLKRRAFRANKRRQKIV